LGNVILLIFSGFRDFFGVSPRPAAHPREISAKCPEKIPRALKNNGVSRF
jgi:hypothetical protein